MKYPLYIKTQRMLSLVQDQYKDKTVRNNYEKHATFTEIILICFLGIPK